MGCGNVQDGNRWFTDFLSWHISMLNFVKTSGRRLFDRNVLCSFCSESEGLFRYGNYRREAEDLHAVVQLFQKIGHVITTIIGHSKGSHPFPLF